MVTNVKHKIPGLDLEPAKTVEVLRQASKIIHSLGQDSWMSVRCQKYLQRLLCIASAFGKYLNSKFEQKSDEGLRERHDQRRRFVGKRQFTLVYRNRRIRGVRPHEFLSIRL